MLRFRKDTWAGNHWPSIEIEPVDAQYFSRILVHLSHTYDFAVPDMVDTLDGYAADFVILSSQATIMIDAWFFSIAFEHASVRDTVFADFIALPGDAFA